MFLREFWVTVRYCKPKKNWALGPWYVKTSMQRSCDVLEMRFTQKFGLDEECMVQLKQQAPSVVVASASRVRISRMIWMTPDYSLQGERCDGKLPAKAGDRECPQPLPFLPEIGASDTNHLGMIRYSRHVHRSFCTLNVLTASSSIDRIDIVLWAWSPSEEGCRSLIWWMKAQHCINWKTGLQRHGWFWQWNIRISLSAVAFKTRWQNFWGASLKQNETKWNNRHERIALWLAPCQPGFKRT